MVRVSIILVALGASVCVGCSRDRDPVQSERPQQGAVSDVLARVGDRSIGASEVASRMATDGLDAKEAIELLIQEEALAQEAARSGFSTSAEDVRSLERLMVRSMLHDLEQENTPETVSEEDVRTTYTANAEQFEVLGSRRSWHILVQSQDDAAQAQAQSILREIRRAKDPRAVYDRYAEGGAGDAEFKLKVEDLPAITEKAGIEKPYKDAIFEAKATGPLHKVIQTSHGWHAIVVTEIVPGKTRTLADAETEIRERISQQRRLGAIVAIVHGLETEGLVQYDETGVQRLLSMPGLPRRAE